MRLFRSMRSPNVFEACNHRRGNKLSCFVESCRNGCSPCVIEELYSRNNAPNWRWCSTQAKQRLFDCLVYAGCGGRVLNWSAPKSFGRSSQRFERGCGVGDLYWNGNHRHVDFLSPRPCTPAYLSWIKSLQVAMQPSWRKQGQECST